MSWGMLTAEESTPSFCLPPAGLGSELAHHRQLWAEIL